MIYPHEDIVCKRTINLKEYSGDMPVFAMKFIYNPDDDQPDNLEIPHDHDFYELVLVIRGDGYHILNGVKSPLCPGLLLFIKPGELHSYEYSGKMVIYNFMISVLLFRKLLPYLKKAAGFDALWNGERTVVDASAIAELDKLNDLIAHENKHNLSDSELFMTAKVIDLLLTILRNRNAKKRPTADVLITVEMYMQKHFNESLKISRLAKMANLSEGSFYRRFRAEFGIGPQQYLIKLRIEHALKYFVNRDMTVTEIAGACGFSDPLYFSRQFHRIMGVSPREYRSMEHGEEVRVIKLPPKK